MYGKGRGYNLLVSLQSDLHAEPLANRSCGPEAKLGNLIERRVISRTGLIKVTALSPVVYKTLLLRRRTTEPMTRVRQIVRSYVIAPPLGYVWMKADLPPLPETEFLVRLEQSDPEIPGSGDATQVISDLYLSMLSLLTLWVGLPLSVARSSEPFHRQGHGLIELNRRYVQQDGVVAIITFVLRVTELPLDRSIRIINQLRNLVR